MRRHLERPASCNLNLSSHHWKYKGHWNRGRNHQNQNQPSTQVIFGKMLRFLAPALPSLFLENNNSLILIAIKDPTSRLPLDSLSHQGGKEQGQLRNSVRGPAASSSARPLAREVTAELAAPAWGHRFLSGRATGTGFFKQKSSLSVDHSISSA